MSHSTLGAILSPFPSFGLGDKSFLYVHNKSGAKAKALIPEEREVKRCHMTPGIKLIYLREQSRITLISSLLDEPKPAKMKGLVKVRC